MKNIVELIQSGVIGIAKARYSAEVEAKDVVVSPTRKEFTGDFTLVVFPFTRFIKKKNQRISPRN